MRILLFANAVFGVCLAILVAFVFYHNGFVWEPDDAIRWWEFGLSCAVGLYFLWQVPFWWLALRDR